MNRIASTKYQFFGIYLALTAMTVLAFWQLCNCDFVNYDDDTYIRDNRHVLTGFTGENMIWAFTSGYAANWHPVTWLSHMLDCQLFGLNPHWHHLTNLLFHILNALLLFTVLKQMTGALWPSAFVAAVFALHPLHVESIAWISERKDVLSTFFWILTMICYIRYVKHPKASWYLLILFVFTLGLMSKPMLVTLPFVLLLIDYWPLERFKKNNLYRLILEKMPLFILSATSCIITFIVQQKGGAVAAVVKLPLGIRISNCFISYVKYIAQIFWPSKLAVFYPYHMHSIPTWQVILAVWFLLAVSVLVIVFASRYKYLPVGWLWYLGTLVPVIGLVQVGEQAMADRYTYVPLIGLFIILAWGIPDLLGKWKYQRIFLTVTASSVILALSICTYFQVSYWRNSASLFEHALAVTDKNYIAHHSLGIWFYKQGKLDLSIAHSFEALRINPGYSPAYAGLGTVFMQKGRMDEAVKYLTKALQLKYDQPDAMNNLAWLLAVYKGTEFYAPSEAIPLAQTACKLTDYKNPEMLDTLATAYAAAGNFTEAVATAEKALTLAKSEGTNQIAEGIRQRLDLFKNNQPYIEPVTK